MLYNYIYNNMSYILLFKKENDIYAFLLIILLIIELYDVQYKIQYKLLLYLLK